ncbi:MAG: nitroreductase family protein [Acidobacteria bacterium]|nr:nitroreductase family protein [Acidobacteriota bacterium]MCG2815965.1 nitroreductase family protein [Candidatus Aminicenantes bacterium]MBU1475620.1 nitroreductase family protein [Acidobacteriota bacterium]MBU4254498.1 nitroreductase family protein [Acidobacteriota bacterium]MBU4329792.1 nitroreductase family protein [Acidobacteriota bacterium]
MSVLDIIRRRRSVRKYRPDAIPDEVLGRVLEAARLAPSGKNSQPWKFILVRDPERKTRLAEACRGQMFMAAAPVIFVACGYPERSYPRQGNYMKSWSIDVACAVDHLMLQACEEGLGTCWIGAFEEKDVKRLLNVPDEVRVLALTPIGFPDEIPRDRGRMSLDDILCDETYS